MTGGGFRFAGKDHPNWKGGRMYSRGYCYSWKPDHPNRYRNYVASHRLVYEQYLSILFDEEVFIPEDQDVHHINGNKQDNSLINLELLSRSKHTSHHFKKDMNDRKCIICKRETFTTKKGYQKWYKYKDGYMCSKCNDVKRYYRYLGE